VRYQANARGQPARDSLQLHELDQQSDGDNGKHLRHDGGKHGENRRGRSQPEQGEGQAEEHRDDPHDQADEGELARMRRPVSQHAEAHQDR
jgi:hypothetical protein